jgi:hypothetical protein
MALALDSASKARILDFIRPLSVGLDGMTNYGFVERRIRISDFLEGEERRRGGAAGEGGGCLFLLAAFAGLPTARRITPDGRESLLLRSLHIPLEEISFLSSSLSRLESRPETPEERIVHDAMLLESVGAYGVTQILVSGVRERMTLAEVAGEIDAKMDAARFATEAGRRLAAGRIAYAKDFAAKLRAEAAEFEPPEPPAS